MNKQRFIDLITHSTEGSSADLKDLEEVVKNFPYCQAAHILFAKASYETDNMLAEKRIRKAAAYAFDRKNLKKIIHQSRSLFKAEHKPFTPILQAPAPENLLEEKVLIEEIQEENIATSETIREAAAIAETRSSEQNSSDTTPESGKVEAPAQVEITATEPESANAETITEPSETKTEVTTPPIGETSVEQEQKKQEAQEETMAEEPPLSVEEIPVEPENRPIPTGKVIANSKEFFEDLQKNLQDLRKLKEAAAQDDYATPTPSGNGTLSETSSGTPAQSSAVMPEKKYAFPEDKIYEELSQKEAFKGRNKIHIEKFPWEKVEIFLKKEEEKNAFLEKNLIERDFDNEEVTNENADLHIQYLKYLDIERKQLDKKQVESIIDRFIKEDPTIPPLNPQTLKEEQEDLSAKSAVESKGPVSENFAKILVRQGKIQKAIDIYTQLSLKNPEKSTYFAGLINELKTKNNL